MLSLSGSRFLGAGDSFWGRQITDCIDFLRCQHRREIGQTRSRVSPQGSIREIGTAAKVAYSACCGAASSGVWHFSITPSSSSSIARVE